MGTLSQEVIQIIGKYNSANSFLIFLIQDLKLGVDLFRKISLIAIYFFFFRNAECFRKHNRSMLDMLYVITGLREQSEVLVLLLKGNYVMTHQN